MATAPTNRTWTTGEQTDYSMMNDLSNSIDFFMNPPGTHVYRAVGQSVAVSTTTLVSWDTVYSDNVSGWASGNPSRVVAQYDGVYNVVAGALWTQGTSSWAGSVFSMVLAKNSAGTRPAQTSANIVGSDVQVVPGFGYQGPEVNKYQQGAPRSALAQMTPPESHIDTQVRLSTGDYVEMWLRTFQGSSATKHVNGGLNAATTFFLAIQWNGA